MLIHKLWGKSDIIIIKMKKLTEQWSKNGVSEWFNESKKENDQQIFS